MGILEQIYSIIRKFRINLETDRSFGRVMVVLLFVLGTTWMLPRNYILSYFFEVGKPWQSSDLFAPFDFAVQKNSSENVNDKDSILQNVNEIFILKKDFLDKRVNIIQYYNLFLPSIQLFKMKPTEDNWNEITYNQKIKTSYNDIKLIVNQALDNQYSLENMKIVTLRLYEDIYRIGLIDKAKKDVKSRYLSLRTTSTQEGLVEIGDVFDENTAIEHVEKFTKNLKTPQKNIIVHLIKQILEPNYVFDQKLYEFELSYKLQSTTLFSGKIAKGQLIIRKGQKVTEETQKIIKSLVKEKNENHSLYNRLMMFFGQFIIVVLLTLVLLEFLRVNRKSVYFRTQQLSFLLTIYFIMVSLMVLILHLSQLAVLPYDVNYYHIAPLSMAAIIITIFFDDRIGFVSNIMICTLVSLIVPNSFEFFFIQSVTGCVGVYSVSLLRNRSQFFVTTGLLLVVYLMSYLGYNLVITTNFNDINYNNIFLFFSNVTLTLLTYPLIYLFERVFGVSSDLAYLELLDTQHPLLHELSIQAPGTYQHSLQVANLAEAAATKIGAHGLKVRVAGLFHDIGKLYHPEYFSENQKDRNVHANLDPKQSAQIIIDHVANGVKLAENYNLPTEIIDFIKTHHGNTRVEYFYRKHISQNPNTIVDENEFRYPGPLPYTKEQAVVMLSDSVEAAARSLDEPTAEDLIQLVDKIFAHKINDNQLAHAHITFRELNKIKAELAKSIITIHHKRIKYPDQKQ